MRTKLFGSKTAPAGRAGERLVFWVFRLAAYLVLLAGASIFLTIAVKGSRAVFTTEPPFLNIAFLTERPESLHVFQYQGQEYNLGDRDYRAFLQANPAAEEALKTSPGESYVYAAGGIFPTIVGTVLLVVGSMTIAMFLGICAAIYLHEYAHDGRFLRLVRLTILNLAGVPSIVFGLFGYGMFVLFFGWETSLLAGWFTLAFMVLPVVITAAEEALKGVPHGFREGSLALGATKWQTIWKNVLPYAMPGILTSSILGIARVAGETAPIMFTAAVANLDRYPWQVEHAKDFFFQGVMALPYHIYVVSSKIPQNEHTARVQYGSAFVFLILVALIASASVILRSRLRSRYRW